MEENYEVVPNIISGKDLDYLSDMFNWNYGAYKKAVNGAENVTDEELKEMLDRASNTFYDHLTKILNIMNNGGNNE